MSDDSTFLADAFRRQLGELVTPAAIRAIESGGPHDAMWGELVASGFLDASVPESAGGAGLGLAEVFPLVLAAGEHALPLPFAETMIARGLVAAGGASVPEGAVVVLAGASQCLPGGSFATHGLVERDGAPVLVAATGSGPDLFRLGGSTGLDTGAVVATLPAAPGSVLLAAAAVTAALMAGAMARVLAMTLAFAGDRQQFGRPLGKFQAIQQNLAVLAEQVISAQVAARGAFQGQAFDAARVAAAKCRASEAATVVCSVAHAVHGAIGATAEFDLQLYTRRIKQGQLAFGSESFWGERLGRMRIAAGSATTADYLRENLAYASR